MGRGSVWAIAAALLLPGCGGLVSGGDSRGTENAPCYDNGTCDPGLTCGADRLCHATPVASCDGVTCSGHGTCQINGSMAVCSCETGYHISGLDCLPDGGDDPCDGVTCSGYGACQPSGDAAICQCYDGYSPSGLECVASSGMGQAVLTWEAPTVNTDGSELDNLAGYKLHYGMTSGQYSTNEDIGMPTCNSVGGVMECSYTVGALGSGTWFFSVTAYNTAGVESTYSNEAQKTIP